MDIHKTITITEYLNRSTDYNLTCDFPTPEINTLDLVVNCRNGEDINDSIIITYDYDFTPPVIDLIFPDETAIISIVLFSNS